MGHVGGEDVKKIKEVVVSETSWRLGVELMVSRTRLWFEWFFTHTHIYIYIYISTYMESSTCFGVLDHISFEFRGLEIETLSP